MAFWYHSHETDSVQNPLDENELHIDLQEASGQWQQRWLSLRGLSLLRNASQPSRLFARKPIAGNGRSLPLDIYLYWLTLRQD